MKFACRFVGGPNDGKMANVSVEKFIIGSILQFDEHTYMVSDGPAARLFEQNQIGSEYLMCNVIFVPPKVEKPKDDLRSFINIIGEPESEY